MTRMVTENGKQALTEYWLLQEFQKGKLLKVKLHTGRTHQIRVHFSHVGTPLIGDDLYLGRTDPFLQRQALHCREISFCHPFTHENIQITAPLPADFSAWLERERK